VERALKELQDTEKIRQKRFFDVTKVIVACRELVKGRYY